MIDKIHGNYILVCDGCCETEIFDNFEAALIYAKENNWTVEKNSKNEWENYCTDCK